MITLQSGNSLICNRDGNHLRVRVRQHKLLYPYHFTHMTSPSVHLIWSTHHNKCTGTTYKSRQGSVLILMHSPLLSIHFHQAQSSFLASDILPSFSNLKMFYKSKTFQCTSCLWQCYGDCFGLFIYSCPFLPLLCIINLCLTFIPSLYHHCSLSFLFTIARIIFHFTQYRMHSNLNITLRDKFTNC